MFNAAQSAELRATEQDIKLINHDEIPLGDEHTKQISGADAISIDLKSPFLHIGMFSEKAVDSLTN